MSKKTNIILVAILALSVFTAYHNTHKTCINVYIDYGSLDHDKKIITCTNAKKNTNALVLLKSSGFNIEGTQKYGNQIVCRVNDLPSKAKESCTDMPPEDAYWAVLIKHNAVFPDPFSPIDDWRWAQTGISDVYLNPGDSIGLVFSVNENVKFPD